MPLVRVTPVLDLADVARLGRVAARDQPAMDGRGRDRLRVTVHVGERPPAPVVYLHDLLVLGDGLDPTCWAGARSDSFGELSELWFVGRVGLLA